MTRREHDIYRSLNGSRAKHIEEMLRRQAEYEDMGDEEAAYEIAMEISEDLENYDSEWMEEEHERERDFYWNERL